MKVFVCTDTHKLDALEKALNKAKKEKADYIIHCGDISVFGSDLDEIVALLDSTGITTFMMPGNHEEGTDLKEMCMETDNVLFVHGAIHREGRLVFIFWGGGGFARRDREFEDFVERMTPDLKKGDKLILCTHGPPYKTKLDALHGDHVGNISYRKFIEKYRPVLVFCGHLHENFNVSDKVGKAALINPGPEGTVLEIKNK